jgi:hypothetical protein
LVTLATKFEVMLVQWVVLKCSTCGFGDKRIRN